MGRGMIVEHYCGLRIKTGLSRQRQIVADVVALVAVTFSLLVGYVLSPVLIAKQSR